MDLQKTIQVLLHPETDDRLEQQLCTGLLSSFKWAVGGTLLLEMQLPLRQMVLIDKGLVVNNLRRVYRRVSEAGPP